MTFPSLSSFGGLATSAVSSLGASALSSAIPSQAFGAVGAALGAGGALASANTLAAAGGALLGDAAQKAFSSLAPGESPAGGSESGANPVWNFVVAPEDISWDTAVAANRIDIFGTNTPPVIVGTKGMRDLSLSNAMVEGFTRARTVEGRVHALEKLMRFSLNGEKGFVNVPVYKVCANAKEYGNANGEDGGYFVIKDVKIKETMRDLQGQSTRAFADISLVQVPAFQVDTGSDQASATVSAASSSLGKAAQTVAGQATQNKPGQTPSPAAGSAAPSPAPPPKPPAAPATPSPGSLQQPKVTPILF